MKTRFLGFLASMLIASNVCCAVDWLHNYAAAQKKSQETSKPIVVFFSAMGCHWCDQLEKEVFDTKEFDSKAGDKFVFVKLKYPTDFINADSQSNTQISAANGISSYPVVIVFDSKGQKLLRTGYEQIGASKYADKLLQSVKSPS